MSAPATQARQLPSPGHLAFHTGIAAFLAAVFSVTPIDVWFPLAVVGLPYLLWVERKRIRRTGESTTTFVKCSVAVLVLIAASLAPLKNLDGSVGPLSYDKISLEELCDRLTTEQGIPCRSWDLEAERRIVPLHTTRPMPRREVMREVARMSDSSLVLTGCGNGSSILFGVARYYIVHPNPIDDADR